MRATSVVLLTVLLYAAVVVVMPSKPVALAVTVEEIMADSICPGPIEGGHQRIVDLLTLDSYEDFRSEIGITDTDTTQIRVLADSTDAHVCQHFVDNVKLPPTPVRIWGFYEANSFYYIATRAATSTLALRAHPLIIFDSTLTGKKAIGM